MLWWHRYVLRHGTHTRRVSVPMFDPWARGVLITCDCGRTWAK